MKILRISGRNLASLAAEFTVDFESEPLASSGLFAICGPTGAGKSTLLDALCLALYDDTPRLVRASRSQLQDVGANMVSGQDPRSLLRRGAVEGHAEVEFVGNDGIAYRARWSVRRSYRKATGALQAQTMSLHRLPELQQIGSNKSEVLPEIAKRIGLSFDQFTRAVLLAQNEFSAFLKTDDNERGELLETLTGSAVYSEISKRAFERHKHEQKVLERLSERLADQAPLAPEERVQLQLDSAAGQEALAVIDLRRGTVEQELRWHQEAERLGALVALAETALAASRTATEQAGERRRRLASLDALQPARPLLAEAARLAAEGAATAQAQVGAVLAAQQAQDARAAAATALTEAAARVQSAEEARRAATPQFDQAKALDAAIGALADPHEQARKAASTAKDASQAAQAAQEARASTLARTRAELQQSRSWLEQNGQWEKLALQWPRWDALLAQSEQATIEQATLAASLLASAQALGAANAGAAAEENALAAAASQLAERDTIRRDAIERASSLDFEALTREREALDARRDSLAGARAALDTLTLARGRAQDIETQLARVRADTEAARAALAEAGNQQPALQAALAQAERSLGAAELACADSVVELRARLEVDAPCPVCGSAEHPYHQRSDALHDMLRSLRGEVTRCRTALQDSLAQQAAQQALATRGAEQLAQLARERGAANAALQAATLGWTAHPLSSTAPGQEPLAWLQEAVEANQSERARYEERARSARQAWAAREKAQKAHDESAAAHAQLQVRVLGARQQLAQADAAHTGLNAKAAQVNESLRSLLAQLDEALDWQADWRDSWHADPGALRAALARHSSRWREQAERATQLDAALRTQEAELAGATAEAGRSGAAAHALAAELAQIDTRLAALRGSRHALWEGRPVAEVERTLAEAVEGARAALARQQEAAQALALAETRAQQELDGMVQRARTLEAALGEAGARIDAWLVEHAEAHPQLDLPRRKDELERMLATDAAALAQERQAIDALDAAVTQALTVLHERRRQLAAHLGERVCDPAAQAAAQAAMDALLLERAGIDGNAAALRMALARDDERRERAREVLAEIEAQQLVERRWGRMNDLIGSADGKKFRNYAQQFTLDVLLGYANRHLTQLARRYRLERVVHASGPSLALMVRDQDMGGEIRSVASLSGGESFLVSLALALGLASLSSNRVRVESLFIDEGFGSLDSDTLRVAMEALDALQSMGRKVGVISHVQEMTERIATRVLVQPAGAGASTVSVQ